MEIPNKETVGIVESIFGKTGAKILISIIVVGAALGAIGVGWATLKALYDGVAPYVPATVPSWVLPFVIAPILIAGMGYLIWQIYGRLNTLGVLVDGAISGTEEAAAELDKAKTQVRSLEDRVAYLESQVGDQLTNLLVGQTLKAQGIEVGPIKRELSTVNEPGVDSRWTAEQTIQMRRARALLYEATLAAREITVENPSLDQLTSQAWLIGQMQELINRGFGFNVYLEFTNFLEVEKKRRKQSGQPASAKETLLAVADYFEKLIPNLTPEDVEGKIRELPDTFKAFMAMK